MSKRSKEKKAVEIPEVVDSHQTTATESSRLIIHDALADVQRENNKRGTELEEMVFPLNIVTEKLHDIFIYLAKDMIYTAKCFLKELESDRTKYKRLFEQRLHLCHWEGFNRNNGAAKLLEVDPTGAESKAYVQLITFLGETTGYWTTGAAAVRYTKLIGGSPDQLIEVLAVTPGEVLDYLNKAVISREHRSQASSPFFSASAAREEQANHLAKTSECLKKN